MSIRDRKKDRRGGTDVVGDFDAADVLLSLGNKGATTPTPPPPQPPTSAVKKPRKPKVNPWDRVAFNSKVPRWIRSAFRDFADREDVDLQDLHAVAMLYLMTAVTEDFDLARYLPHPEVSPPTPHTAKLAELLEELGFWNQQVQTAEQAS